MYITVKPDVAKKQHYMISDINSYFKIALLCSDGIG